MTESQLKYMNKVKLISFIILVAGLLLVLVWSIMKNNVNNNGGNSQSQTLAINYENAGAMSKYDFTCATTDCILSSQAGTFALVRDGAYKLIDLVKGTNKQLTLPTMTKNFMVADTEFYGLVYTKDESNKASFYDYANNKTLFEDELSYEKMNEEEIRTVLNKMFPRKLLYVITDETSMVVNMTDGEPALQNVKGAFYYENELYVVNSGLHLFKEDGTVEARLEDTKEVYKAVYKDSIVILDKDNIIKVATLKGVKGDKILELGENKVHDINVTNGILRIVLEDKDYATNNKLVKYEYDFETKKLKTVE
jgi:uncharacterized protein with PQ loop repeat